MLPLEKVSFNAIDTEHRAVHEEGTGFQAAAESKSFPNLHPPEKPSFSFPGSWAPGVVWPVRYGVLRPRAFLLLCSIPLGLGPVPISSLIPRAEFWTTLLWLILPKPAPSTSDMPQHPTGLPRRSAPGQTHVPAGVCMLSSDRESLPELGLLVPHRPPPQPFPGANSEKRGRSWMFCATCCQWKVKGRLAGCLTPGKDRDTNKR